jgi:hypothetical protein
VSPHHVCWGIRSTVNLTEKVSGNILRFKTNFVSIRRVTFLAENPAKLLITGLDQARKYRTVLHDLSSGATSDVSAEGPVYKSTLSGERIVHTELRRDGFENRELCHGNYTLSPSTIKISQE